MSDERRGGSFAPPLTAEALAAYETLAASAAPQVRDGMKVLIALAAEYRKLESRAVATGDPHPSGRGRVVSLAVAVADAIDPLLPWDDELKMYAQVFDRIDPIANGPLRDAAHHLLWYAVELSLGREPITTDRL